MRKIICQSNLYFGQPHIEGTLLTIPSLLAMLSRTHNLQSILEIYTEVTLEELKHALIFASEVVDQSQWFLSGIQQEEAY